MNCLFDRTVSSFSNSNLMLEFVVVAVLYLTCLTGAELGRFDDTLFTTVSFEPNLLTLSLSSSLSLALETLRGFAKLEVCFVVPL